MQVGDLVETIVFKAAGVAIIIKLDEPTVRKPYQIATVQFADGTEEEYVTTVLRGIK